MPTKSAESEQYSIRNHKRWITKKNEMGDLSYEDLSVLALTFGFGLDVEGFEDFAKTQQAKANYRAANGIRLFDDD